jgi:hypothetical protein
VGYHKHPLPPRYVNYIYIHIIEGPLDAQGRIQFLSHEIRKFYFQNNSVNGNDLNEKHENENIEKSFLILSSDVSDLCFNFTGADISLLIKRTIAIFITEFNAFENEKNMNEKNEKNHEKNENITVEKYIRNQGLQLHHFTGVLKTMKSSVSEIEIDEYNNWNNS